MRLTLDGSTIESRQGDTVLVAMARSGQLPSGCLCAGGDCPNCLATIDGVSHVRMCQTRATDGMEVFPFPVQSHPPLPTSGERRDIAHRFQSVDVVVIGNGSGGRQARESAEESGRSVVVVDAGEGAEAIGIYPGPEVVARIDGAMVRIRCQEVVVATGAAELQPVAPGSHLAGILTPRAIGLLVDAGVELGRVVAVGPAPEGLNCTAVAGTIVRFEGSDRVTAVVVEEEPGVTSRHPCDTVVVALGTYPRDSLLRMARGSNVTAVGGAASSPTLPACPTAGTVCQCSEVAIEDLDFVWDRGFRELELIKRATLAGTGTCQGGVCSPYLRSFVRARGGELQETFTARPPARQLTIAEAAAGHRMPPIHRTGLDRIHRSLGARMDRIGGWWRPWTYPDPEREYWSVRQGVSLGDVSTLGKLLVRGADATEFLEKLYPCRVSDLAPGRSRYALVLAESGGLLDDGLISRIDETTYALTFTSGGASFAEAWLRDWAHGFGADVRIMDRTHSLGAINVTGPEATRLLQRAGLESPIRFMHHAEATIAGVDSRVFRLSFTGEVSYELHHSVSRSPELWEHLIALGSDLDIAPHGLMTLQTLRLEKGHVIVGMDTEPDSTPRRLGMEWAVKMDKPAFVGKAALERTGRVPLDRKLVGLTMDGPSPTDGTPVYVANEISGYVTSSAWSPTLERVVMLAWVKMDDGTTPAELVVDGRKATESQLPFYDPEGTRARA